MVAPEAYRDLLQAAARETGQNLLTVAKVVSAAMLPLKGAVWGIEKTMEWLGVAITKRLAGVDPEKIKTPALHIAGPALVNLQFSKDAGELREMYANLLASAMTDGAREPHPSFVQVIQQLTPEEARILRWISLNKSSDELAADVVGANWGTMGSGRSLEQQFETIAVAAGITNEEAGHYLDNLRRLRILALDQLTGTEHERRAHDWQEGLRSIATRTQRVLYVTEFGVRFLLCCVDTARELLVQTQHHGTLVKVLKHRGIVDENPRPGYGPDVYLVRATEATIGTIRTAIFGYGEVVGEGTSPIM